jgi:hypothetical protein
MRFLQMRIGRQRTSIRGGHGVGKTHSRGRQQCREIFSELSRQHEFAGLTGSLQ